MFKKLAIFAAAGVLWTGLAVEAAHGQIHANAPCATCHVPHKAVPPTSDGSFGPLWNPTLGAVPLPTFNLYTSPTFDALATGISQPDGTSKLCLCCHDGGYGAINPVHTFGDTAAMTLTESHPISFVYNTALSASTNLHVPGSLKDPSSALSGVTPSGTIAADLLDTNGKVQCTTCHDIHHSGISEYHLRIDYTADNGKTMCRTCHNK
ncbi:MAG: hypothetical protein PHU85_05165 [Phycisphaerae bacterium]|nr:hypothetical protein [Phycisphaerae bacterium]